MIPSRHSVPFAVGEIMQHVRLFDLTPRPHTSVQSGQTPLHIAVIMNAVECVRVLCTQPHIAALPDDEHKTPLHRAAEGWVEGCITEMIDTHPGPCGRPCVTGTARLSCRPLYAVPVVE